MKWLLYICLLAPLFCCACDPVWERREIGYHGPVLWRLRVDGGWQIFLEADYNSSTIFMRDENHQWIL